MPKKSLSSQPSRQSDTRGIESAVEKGDLPAIRELIRQGVKPGARAAELAVDTCWTAYYRAHVTEQPLFGLKPSKKSQGKGDAQAELYYQILEALLRAGAPVPEYLPSAARSGFTKLTLLLIKHGADVDYSPPLGTPLENAVTSGDIGAVRALIKAGADINVQGISGNLLSRAVQSNHPEMLREIIKAGVNLDAKPKIGASPLLEAVSSQRDEIVKILLKAGADVDVKGDATCGDFGEPRIEIDGSTRVTNVPNPPTAYRSTPLIVATRVGNVRIASQLIKAGADVDALDREGLSALYYAQNAKRRKLVELLVKAGAKPLRHPEGNREAAFMAAATRGDCELLKELLDEGLDPDLQRLIGGERDEDQQHRTALGCAAENGRVEAITLLLKHGAKPDRTFGANDYDAGCTALMLAAQKGQVEAAKALMSGGASPLAKDSRRRTVLHYAAEGGSAEIIRLLVKARAKMDLTSAEGTPLMESAQRGRAEAVKALLELGADPNVTLKEGYSAMWSAATGGHAETVRILLAAGANPDSTSTHTSPLDMASFNGHKDVVALLLAAKADRASSAKGKDRMPSVEDNEALATAALMGKLDIVKALLTAGADPNSTDKDGRTALMAAVRSEVIESVKVLLEAGANVNALNQSGETALDLAYDNIRRAKDMGKVFKMMGKLDHEGRDAMKFLKNMGGTDDITALLEAAGGKRGANLPKPEMPSVPAEPVRKNKQPEEEEPLPDFRERAKSSKFNAAVREFEKLCGKKSKACSNDEEDSMHGCVRFSLPTDSAAKLLRRHHEKFLKRGCYLVKTERGFSSGKDELTMLPTTDRAEVLRAYQTSGPNFSVYNEDIIKWLDKLEKTHPFLLTGCGYDWCEGPFKKPVTDAKKLARKMYKFCPDIVDQGVESVTRLASELEKRQEFFFWWD